MAQLRSNGLSLEYETFGDSTAPPILLVSGWGAQLIFWEDEFCEHLAARGFNVIRFDNRDVGLSDHLDHLGTPDVQAVRAGKLAPPYTLDDLACDTVGLLDALGLSAAHVVGISMGGYIGQLVAIRYPERVLTLVSMMSGPGGDDMAWGGRHGGPDLARFSAPAPSERDDIIETRLSELRLASSGRYFNLEREREATIRSLDRAYDPSGVLRQAAAIHAAPSRISELAELHLPLLVIHGELDPSLLPECGRRTAAASAGARLVMLPDIGHELPPEIWSRIIDLIAEHADGLVTADG